MKPECANCKHAMDRDPLTVWCRRYPPAMAFVQVGKASMLALPGGATQATVNGEWISQFPCMQKTGLCGEWDSRLEDILREQAREAARLQDADRLELGKAVLGLEK